ncbi:MAG: preprotein translocase subunit SecE [Anaerovoracaceae bacterium]|jgi:preprotein translocase subunit SecE
MANNNKKKNGNNKNGSRQNRSAMDRARTMAISGNTNKKKGSRRDFWRGVKQEMSKVVWPTRQELASYSVIVIVTCAAFALFFWAVDTGFLALLKAILGITLS